MPTNPVMPLLEEQIAAAVEAYRQIVAKGTNAPIDQFLAEGSEDPGSVAAEIVDVAADELDYVISFDWDTPDRLRDAIYRTGYVWGQALTAETLNRPFTAADVVL